jgi:hypothetical protein
MIEKLSGEQQAVMCARKGCVNEAFYYPAMRERGRNTFTCLLKLPICVSCSLQMRPEMLIAPGRFPDIQRLMRISGHWVGKMEDIEVVRVRMDDPECVKFSKKN